MNNISSHSIASRTKIDLLFSDRAELLMDFLDQMDHKATHVIRNASSLTAI